MCFVTVLSGLDYAVKSMKTNEKAQFLIDHEYCFGKMGHPPRIPENATFFFQIELLRFSDTGAALDFYNITQEEKKRFSNVHKIALGLSERAKERINTNIKSAIRDYNRAIGLLDDCNLLDMEEQVQQEQLKLKLYTNLSICYVKDDKPKKACSACNEIYNLVKDKNYVVPAKVYYNNGKALRMIGEYGRAKEKLLTAQKLQPRDAQIMNELRTVTKLMKQNKDHERSMAKVMMGLENKESEENEEEEIDENNQFYKAVNLICSDLVKGNDKQYTLPAGLSTYEINIAEKVARKAGLVFEESLDTFYIKKHE